MTGPIPLRRLNAMTRDQFVATIGHVFEQTPGVAAEAWTQRPFADVAALRATMRAVVEQFDDVRRDALLRAHPELGGRAPMAALSVDEQRGAGLHDAEQATRDELAALNTSYRERFGIPFIIAVRGRGPAEILDAMRTRMGNTAADERRTALGEVLQIASLRLAALVTDDDQLGVDGARLNARLGELARIGGTARGGVTRLAYSPEDIAARALVERWMGEAGLSTVVDAATNLIGSRPGSAGLPAIVMGSHLDTVVEGGALDGAYGVVAAVEVAAALDDAGAVLRHPLAVIAFSNEEGANGTPGMVGSQVVAGTFGRADLDLVDDDGVSIAALLAGAGGAPEAIDGAAWAAGSIAGYLELHIEQGPVLADRGIPIGIVEAITGRRNVEIVVAGTANHAGTTPMDLRHDAFAAAAEVVLAVEQLPADGLVRVATVGHVVAEPNVRNVVPGRVVLGADVRDVDAARIDVAIDVLRTRVGEIGRRRGVTVEVQPGPGVEPAPCDPGLVGDISTALAALDLPAMALPSGAGHDAQVVAAIAPIAMVFVPSRDGISHNPAEHTDPDALTQGADVLLHTVLATDRRDHA